MKPKNVKKLLNLFKSLDKQSQCELYEMAVSKKECIDRIKDLSYQICRHFIKIACFDNPNDLKGHYKSLNAWLDDIQQLKTKGGSISEKTIF